MRRKARFPTRVLYKEATGPTARVGRLVVGGVVERAAAFRDGRLLGQVGKLGVELGLLALGQELLRQRQDDVVVVGHEVLVADLGAAGDEELVLRRAQVAAQRVRGAAAALGVLPRVHLAQ